MKTHPGSVVHLSDNPLDSNKVRVVFTPQLSLSLLFYHKPFSINLLIVNMCIGVDRI